MIIERFNDGIDDRRLIVKRHPLSPQAHMVLGSFLGMVGKHLSNREMINEGINECKIAAALCEGWDTPLGEHTEEILVDILGYKKEDMPKLLDEIGRPTVSTPVA